MRIAAPCRLARAHSWPPLGQSSRKLRGRPCSGSASCAVDGRVGRPVNARWKNQTGRRGATWACPGGARLPGCRTASCPWSTADTRRSCTTRTVHPRSSPSTSPPSKARSSPTVGRSRTSRPARTMALESDRVRDLGRTSGDRVHELEGADAASVPAPVAKERRRGRGSGPRRSRPRGVRQLTRPSPGLISGPATVAASCLSGVERDADGNWRRGLSELEPPASRAANPGIGGRR